MTKVIVFGGGISGLTAVHELVKKGFQVILVEKDSIIGGMAKTRWEENGVPSEHSWRGWGNFYSNAFNIMKQIPHNEGTTYDNLTKEVDFYILRNELYPYKRYFTLRDYIVLTNDITQYLTSSDRRRHFYETKASEYYQGKVSKDTYEFLLKYVQTAGYGMENKDGSVGHLLRFMVLPLTNPNKYRPCHNLKDGKYCNKTDDKWHLLNQPTNNGWFDPWKKYLEKQGVTFIMNTELVKIKVNDERVINVEVKKNCSSNIMTLEADEYVLCLNPFNTEDILKNSRMTLLYDAFKKVNESTTSNQISFRVGLNKVTKYPTKHIGIVLTDSPFNITFYPQNTHWENYDDMNIPYKTLWSGTLMDSISKGVIYDKSSITLNIDELKEEIKAQILNSESFQKLMHDSNGFRILPEDIVYIEIWYEWQYDKNKSRLTQSYKKWVNNVHNEKYRPGQETNYTNLFLAGAHTKTTTIIYSMEGAVESGLLAANKILSKYKMKEANVVKHNDPGWLEPFKMLDNLLYKAHLPSIVVVFIFCLLLLLYIHMVKK